MASFLTIANGIFQRIAAIVTSGGSVDADKLVATNSSGQFDNSFINWASPSAIGGTTPNTVKTTALTATGTSHSFGGDANAFTLLNINGAATANKQLVFQTASKSRWNFYVNGAGGEPGSDGGSPFVLSYYTDAGVYKNDTWAANRAGQFVVYAAAQFTNTTDSSSSTTGTTFSGGVGIAKALNVGTNAGITGNLSVTGTLKVSSGGSAITRVLLASSSALDTISFAAAEIKTATVTVTGATIGDQVNANPSSATPNTNIHVYGYVSATNTVTVVAYNRAATSQSFSGNVKISVVG